MPLYDGNCRVFASHAEPEDPIVQQLLQGAEAALEARTGRGHTDFAQAALAGAEPVRDAAWVIYEKILCLKPEIEFDPVPRLEADKQHFRSISEMKQEQKANCLELSMLFASCALRAHLKPVLITLDIGHTDHAFIGIWLNGTGSLRIDSCQRDGTIAPEKIPDLLGLESLGSAEDYLNRISSANMLVLDCAGAALGYPGNNNRCGLRFERAVTRAWTMLTSQSSKIRCVLDLCQARCEEIPFPVKIRPDFVGRKDDLQAVEEEAASKNIAICGNVGVGKSALALEYAFEYREKYPEGVFRLNAANEDRTLEQLANFAREWGMDSNRGQDHSEEPPTDFQLADMWEKKVNKLGTRVLLILDDVVSASFITTPVAGMFSLSELKCRLLITTRNSQLLPDDQRFKNIPLAPLYVDDAATLLLNALPPDRRDRRVARRICKQLGNLPLLIRVAGQKLSDDDAPTLPEYEQKLLEEGLLPAATTPLPSDYPWRSVEVILNRAWDDLAGNAAISCEILKLLSILPRNESVPFELLALMVGQTGDEPALLNLVREGASQLWIKGLAEQSEEDAIRVHAFVHEFTARKTAADPAFVEDAFSTAVRRLHEADFYRTREDRDLVRCGEQLRLLREPSRHYEKLSRIVNLFDIQLDYLRNKYDALAQLAMHAHLVGAGDLAKTLEQIRSQRKGPWFRLRWKGSHERNQGPEDAGHSDAVSAVAIWPSEQDTMPTLAVSAAENGEIIAWPLDSLTPRRYLIEQGLHISGLCISPDGQTVYVSAWDGSLRAIPLDDGPRPEPHIFGRHTQPANDCAIDPEGEFLVSVSDDGMAHIYNLAEGGFYRSKGHLDHSPLLKCAMARRSRSGEPVMITASEAGVVRAWNPRTGREIIKKLRILPETAHNPISACALSPDGELAAVATRDNVLLWNLNTGDESTLSNREPYVAGLSFSPDGSRLMLVGRSKQVVVYRIDDRGCDYRTPPWYHWLTACAFGAGGRLFYASDDGSVHTRHFSFRTGQVTVATSIPGRLNWVNVFRAGKTYALSVSTDQSICLWDLANGALKCTIPGSANWVNAFAVSSDGQYILSGTDHGAVIYWPLRNIDGKRTLRGFRERANACAISSDGKIALAASENSTLRLWFLTSESDDSRHLTDGHCAAIRTCAISPDGRYALSGGDDEEVVLWDLESGEFERSFKKHAGRITAVEFVQDQPDIFVSSSWDNKVKCWNARTGRLLREFTEHTDGVTSCGTAAGGVAFSVSLDRTLRRWKLEGGPSDMRVRLEHRLRGLVVDPSGDMVLCSDMSGTVFLFDVMKGSNDKPEGSDHDL